MERVEEYGRIATAKTLARLLSSIPVGAHGPVQICICDLHTLQNCMCELLRPWLLSQKTKIR